MYTEKLESYKKQILDKLYFLTKENVSKSKDWFHLYDKTQFIQNPPSNDKLIIDAAWGDIRYYLKDNRFQVRFSEYGIISYEERYNPPVTIRFKDLIIPVLIAIFEYEISGNSGINIEYIQDFVHKNYNFNIAENDINVVLAILGARNYLNIKFVTGGSFVSWGLTDSGKVEAIKAKPKSPIEKAIKNLSSRLLKLDYYEKDLNFCSIKLKKWVENFEGEKEKLAALFLMENLFIASNELGINAWKNYYTTNFENINHKDIYLLATGGPGSSGGAWLHKFAREIYEGKEQSRSLKAIKGKKDPSDWENKSIIFIDDIIGSGDQFKEFFENNMMQDTGTKKEILSQFKEAHIIYFVVVATEQGINYITQETPLKRENIKCGYLLPKFFDPNNPIWDKTTPITREECLRICEEYGKKLWPEYPLGFLDSQLLVAYQDHTPDNTLPILWWKNNGDWNPLLKR